jgi:Tol biopolymer transport system component
MAAGGAFETLGKLWVKPMAGGEPRRLTSDSEAMEAYPAWSPDGKDHRLCPLDRCRAWRHPQRGGQRRMTSRAR